MKDFMFTGECTYSLDTPDGRRFMTAMDSGQVRMSLGFSPAAVFRVYTQMSNQKRFFLTSLPRTVSGREDAHPLSLPFSGEGGGGEGSLGGSPTILELQPFTDPPNPPGTWIMLNGQCLDCKSGRERPPDFFHLVSPDPRKHGLLKPRSWNITVVRDLPIEKKAGEAPPDLRYVDFRETTMVGKFTGCNLGSARMNGSTLILDLTGSKLPGARVDGTGFGQPVDMDIAGLHSILVKTEWPSASLVGAHFFRCKLKEADFRGATLTSARFPKADLSGARFTGCDLTGVDFTGADLRGADLGGCNLTRANFTDANLCGMNLAGRTMTGAVLTNTWLAGADLSGTDLLTVTYQGRRPRFHLDTPEPGHQKTLLKKTKVKADLLGLDWTGLDLTDTEMAEVPVSLRGLQARFAVLTGRDLTGRDLTGAVFTGSTLTNVKFNGATLAGANLADQDLTTVDFTGATLGGARLERADLTGRDLSSVTANPPPVTSADPARPTRLRKATFKAGLFGKTWTALDMTDAVIQGVTTADLTGMQADDALLVNVSLLGGNFNPAKHPTDPAKDGAVSSFRRTRFHASNLQNTQFRKALLNGAQFGANLRMFEFDAPAEPADLIQAVREHGWEPPPGARLRTDGPDLLDEAEGVKTYLVRRELRSGDRWTVAVNESATAADLSGAYLAGANLTDANLEGVTANRAHIYGGDDSGPPMLAGAMMSLIKLVKANLGTADLTRAKLNGANLQDANLIGATLRGADLSPAAIRRGEEQSTDLTGTHLAGTTFTDAKLGGANLSNAAVPTADGVYVFTLDSSLATELGTGTSRPVSDDVAQAFKGKGVTLAAAAKVSAESSSRWVVDNDSGSQTNTEAGYVVFTVVKETAGLAVFGIKLRVVRLGADDRLEVRTKDLLPPTGLNNTIMTGDTYCPNRQKLRDLQRGSSAWDVRWLRAPDPPKPPPCVPSPDQFCPPEV